ncbi:aspartate/tyrosine/aromatic aminotransferase [Aureobasidium pullulans]|uniref:Aspartate/tyrosine/aromatic aminotransferase n=1 Tax=Aureobasidium pullulans TaxID=5580 RepID=A0AB38LUD1_AURPU|nr:aspartate/tyrosine/aromatic aminotransferase [Aureobasidium pullulans]THZ35318.1 aspartate/tyrosine/aromatic aminotransferase [Aureobasidium pullulans]
MRYDRMPIEIEAPEEYGYENIRYNLSESSFTDQTLESLDLKIPNLKLIYNEHRGGKKLRKLVASGSDSLHEDDVLITSGAAGALFIISTSQLNPESHLVVVRPNYSTNIETPRAIGCEISFIDLTYEDQFQINVAAIEASIKRNTKIVSITCPHNPTGTLISEDSLRQLVAVTKKHNCLLLVDETYRDISYGSQLPIAASLDDHVISVCSLSKSFGAPGIRVGWLICKDQSLQTTFLAAKEQMSISGSVIDEWIAEQLLARKSETLQVTTAEMKIRRSIVAAWIEKEELLEWVQPEGGIVCFPRMTREPVGGTAGFYKRLLEVHGTYVGPGHWFEMPDTSFRVGYGWSTRSELEEGLEAISKALREL